MILIQLVKFTKWCFFVPKRQNRSLFDKSTKFLMGFVARVLSDFRRGGM